MKPGPNPFVLLLAACSIALAGCSSDKDAGHDHDEHDHDLPTEEAGVPGAEPMVFVGNVANSSARVAIVAGEFPDARAYFCGRGDSIGSMTHWFNTLTDETDGGLLSDGYGWNGVLANDVFAGVFTTDEGMHYDFDARRIAKDTIEGLYEATGPCGKIGFIVTRNDSGEFEAQGACSGDDVSDAKQVNPSGPIERGADGTIAVEVDGETFQVSASTLTGS
jgi:hypothetical protein